ncbi:MAG: LysE family transporter [Bacteroidetes bacterium]|nr:LysE family transporter [Fibrella sp.]
MPTLLTNFTFGLLVSFLGTLPLGVLNITVMRVSLRQGLRSALQFALACALVELVYSYLSVELTQSLIAYPALKPLTDGVAALTLLGMGIYYIRKQSTPMTDQRTIPPFYLGALLSVVNVVAFPFWILYTTLLQAKGYVGIMNNALIMLYVLGIALGTMAGLLPFIFGSRYLSRWVTAHQHRFDRIIGLLFVVLSLCQTLTILR